MERLGRISSAEFAALFPHGADYLPGLSWQPTNALFWEQFNNPTNYKDFTLGPEELAVFQTNGFVVSERLGGESFAGVFYDLWHSDQPFGAQAPGHKMIFPALPCLAPVVCFCGVLHRSG
jgi:hypothetical protein